MRCIVNTASRYFLIRIRLRSLLFGTALCHRYRFAQRIRPIAGDLERS